MRESASAAHMLAKPKEPSSSCTSPTARLSVRMSSALHVRSAIIPAVAPNRATPPSRRSMAFSLLVRALLCTRARPTSPGEIFYPLPNAASKAELAVTGVGSTIVGKLREGKYVKLARHQRKHAAAYAPSRAAQSSGGTNLQYRMRVRDTALGGGDRRSGERNVVGTTGANGSQHF